MYKQKLKKQALPMSRDALRRIMTAQTEGAQADRRSKAEVFAECETWLADRESQWCRALPMSERIAR
jgi:hypothetical protein